MSVEAWRKWVCRWVEPDSDGKPVLRSCTVGEAINQMKAQADYESDQAALNEFIDLHWAWIEKD